MVLNISWLLMSKLLPWIIGFLIIFLLASIVYVIWLVTKEFNLWVRISKRIKRILYKPNIQYNKIKYSDDEIELFNDYKDDVSTTSNKYCPPTHLDIIDETVANI